MMGLLYGGSNVPYSWKPPDLYFPIVSLIVTHKLLWQTQTITFPRIAYIVCPLVGNHHSTDTVLYAQTVIGYLSKFTLGDAHVIYVWFWCIVYTCTPVRPLIIRFTGVYYVLHEQKYRRNMQPYMCKTHVIHM